MEDFIKSLIGPAIVGIVSYLAVTIKVRAGSENISKQIKEQVEADRNQRFWNERFNAILELKKTWIDSAELLTTGDYKKTGLLLVSAGMTVSILFSESAFSSKLSTAMEIIKTGKEGDPIPYKKYVEFGDLISKVVQDGFEELGSKKQP